MKKVIINIVVFLSYFIYEQIIIGVLEALGINFSNMDVIKKILILVCVDVSYIFTLIFIYKKELKIDLKDCKANYTKHFKKYVSYYMLGAILMGLSNLILQKLTNTEMSGNQAGIVKLMESYPVYIAFLSVIYAPIVEEIIFRKTIRNIFKDDLAFVIISGVIFGVIHISDYTSIKEILLGIPYIIMGLDFSYIYYKTRNIFITMSFHALHNLLLLIVYLI